MGHMLARERGVPEWGVRVWVVSIFISAHATAAPESWERKWGMGVVVVVTYVVWSLFTCAAGVVQA
jgi:hypothetical protein